MHNRKCNFHGCTNEHEAKGYCKSHYRQFMKGVALRPLNGTLEAFEVRRLSYTQKTDSCWNWVGPKDKFGYGRMKFRSERIYAHRYAYETAFGPIPTSAIIDHICHNRSCVNPAHLRVVNHKQNMENRKSAHKNSKTGIRNVHIRRGKFVVIITHNKVKHYIGAFSDLEDAKNAAAEARQRIFTHSTL